MKKIYFLGLLLGTSTLMFAQNNPQMHTELAGKDKQISTTTNVSTKALGSVIWLDEFNTPADWTIDNDGQTAASAGWDINSVVDGWYLSPMLAPSAGNFAELGNGTDPNAVTATGVTYTMTMANPIDVVALGGSQDVVLEFLQYGARFNDLQEFQISTDGTNFTTVGNNSGYTVLSANGGSVYNNPDQVRINLSQFLSAAPTQLWIRFSWTSRFPTDVDNNAWITYGWMIDNVSIVTLPDHDISTRSLNYGSVGLYYYQIPVAQIAPIESSVVVVNKGSNDELNVKLDAVEVNSGYTASSAPISLVTASEDSVSVTSNFTPSGQGSYKLDYSISYDAVDDVPTNNLLTSYSFNVGDFIYARDSSNQAEIGTLYGQVTGANSTVPEEVQPALLYDIYSDVSLTGIDFQFGDEIAVGENVFGSILDSNRDPIANGETLPYETAAGDARSYQTLVFDTPLQLIAGETYFVQVKSFSNSFSVATAGESAPQTSFVYYPGEDTWYYTTSTPVIRMNFDPSLGLENNELSNLNVSANFPNPFANSTTVQFNLKEASTVSYKVIDLTGKVMTEVAEGNTMAGDHEITIDGSSFANGVYYLNITAGESTVTRKMIVNK